MRLPLDHFAGLAEPRDGLPFSPLQLVVDAAGSSGNYSIFASKPLEVLLEFKWESFVRWRFIKQTAVFLFHCVLITVFNLTLAGSWNQEIPRLTRDEFLGLDGGPVYWGVILLWLYATVSSLLKLRVEMLQLFASGMREYFFDVWNVLDLFYSLGQLTINVAVTLKLEAPELFSPIFEYANYSTDDAADNFTVAAAARRALKAGKGGTSGVVRRPAAHPHRAPTSRAPHSLITTGSCAPRPVDPPPIPSPPTPHPSHPRQAGSADDYGYRTIEERGLEPTGLVVTLQAFVLIACWFRLVAYFRGSLAMSSLLHMVIAILIDMIPFLVMLIIFTVAFSLALHILIKFQVEHLDATETSGEWHIAEEEWGNLLDATYTTFNMGLYAAFDARALKLNWQIVLVFEGFMVIVQVVLFNLLIAIMADTHHRVREQSQLVALYQRSILVLEEEQAVRRQLKNTPLSTRLLRKIFGKAADLPQIYPRWLHVILPNVESNDGGSKDGAAAAAMEERGAADASTAAQLADLARGLAELKQAVASSQQQLLAATATIAAAAEARPAVDVASPPPSPDALRPPPKRAAAPAAAPAKAGGCVGADEVRAIIASELEAMRKRMEEGAPVRVDARRRGE